MVKTRLDLLLVERGLAESRSQAQALVMAGQVRVAGQVELKASASVLPEAQLEVDRGPRFVSRGGDKLEAGLTAFPISVAGSICADVGASTGGFTDCLLQRGARRVYAIDVGKGLLHWKLRSDPRVHVMEETNARYVERLPEPVDLVTIDAAFISLKILLPVVKGWLTPGADSSASAEDTPSAKRQWNVVALVKPQFEAGRKESARHKGVIRDKALHETILMDVLGFVQAQGFAVDGLLRSPVLGPKGNVEFLVWLGLSQAGQGDLVGLVKSVLAE